MKCTIYLEDLLDEDKPYLRDSQFSGRCSCCSELFDYHDRKPVFFEEISPAAVVSDFNSSDDNRYEGGTKKRRQSLLRGMAIFSNGDVYTGDWKRFFMHGRGVMAFANGDRYEGKFKYGCRDGRGRMDFANGDRYYGNWVGGKRWGRGECHYLNGGYYVGEWQNDHPSDEEK